MHSVQNLISLARQAGFLPLLSRGPARIRIIDHHRRTPSKLRFERLVRHRRPRRRPRLYRLRMTARQSRRAMRNNSQRS